MKTFNLILLSLLFSPLLFSQASVAQAQSTTIKVQHKQPYGNYLTNGKGMSLYLFLKDTRGKSACYNKCAKKWPPVILKKGTKIKVGSNVDKKKLGTTKRKNGSLQLTYNNHPLYYFYKDKKAGDVKGQDKMSVWFLLNPSGKMIRTTKKSK